MTSTSERSLVEKVELRFALASTTERFQHVVDVFLPPLLLKLASSDSLVREQVTKASSLVLSRFNSNPELQLPIDSLLQQVQHPQLPSNVDPTTVQSYSLVFVSKGITRLSEEAKIPTIAKVITKISSFNPIISARLFSILCKLIISCDFSQPNIDDGKTLRANLLLNSTNAMEEDFILEKLAKFMLLQPVHADHSGSIPTGFSLPGLSKEDCAFFTYNAGLTFDSTTLTHYKTSIIHFVEYGFNDKSNLVLFCGTADRITTVAELATNILHRKGINFNDPKFIDFLIKLMLGDSITPAVRVQLQTKIVDILSKSEYAIKSPHLARIISVGLGSDYNKLKESTVKFVRWITTKSTALVTGDDDQLGVKIAGELKSNLISSRQEETTSNSSDYLLQRRYQYEALGMILRRNSKALNITYIEFLFEMLSVESPEMLSCIQDCLSGFTDHLHQFTCGEKDRLKIHLVEILGSDIPQGKSHNDREQIARYIAVKYLNAAYPFSDAQARILDIRAQSKADKPETIEEASKGLHPYWFKVQNDTVGSHNQKVRFPSFSEFSNYLIESHLHTNIDKGISFSVRCLTMQATQGTSASITVDSEWENRIDNAVMFDMNTKSALIKLIDTINKDEISSFIEYCFDYFVKSFNPEVGSILIRLLSLCKEPVYDKFVDTIPKLLKGLETTYSTEVKSYISELLGILCSCHSFTDARILEILQNLLKSGLVEPLGYIISRLVLRNRYELVDSVFLNKLLTFIETDLKSTSSMKFSSALNCLSQLLMFGCLGPILKMDKDASTFRRSFIEILHPLLKQRQDELIAMTWSYLLLSYEDDKLASGDTNILEEFVQPLCDANTRKHYDYMFSIGESLTVLAYGWRSHVMDQKIDLRDLDVRIDELFPKVNNISYILKKIIEATSSAKPSLRRSGCIWLLSLVQFCGDSQEILSDLNQLQVVFMRFLTDQEEIIQESASRGLSITYNHGDTELKDELVHNMILSFTDTKHAASLASGSISQETQLFEPGVLKTDNGSISTYKDILNLASDVGDPSLVYKFMSLAKNSSLWSSRKGIAYGLGAILDKTKLDSMLHNDPKLSNNLIPKLYRYMFDPSPSVANAMHEIWNSLISDQSKTIHDNYEQIISILLKGMGAREWRVRQASTSALDDLLQRSQLSDYTNHLKEIWRMAFRSVDDIKESVRKVGTVLTSHLSKLIVQQMNQTKNCKDILAQMLPYLLGNNGLLSDSEDVKSFALHTLLKIIDTGSSSLKPFVNDTIKQLIMLMSSVEPQVVNYLSLNADKYKMKAQDIDVQRLNLVGHSPLMQAIETLMDLLDDSMMLDFVDKLSEAVKGCIGLPSKVAGSRVVVDSIVHNFFVSKNYGDSLLKICMGQLKNHNETVSSSYGLAAGYCVRVASNKKVHKLSKKLRKYYFESESDNNYLQRISSRTCNAVVKYSKDKFESVASSFLPLAFIGMHDADKIISNSFKEAWEDSIGSNANAIKLYFTEIVKLIHDNITTNNTSLRKTIGLSITEIIDRLGSQVGKFPDNLETLFDVLLTSLEGRTYRGKENLLKSFVSLSTNCPEYLNDHPEMYKKVTFCILTEAQKKNMDYRKYSVRALGRFLGAFGSNEEMYSTYIDLIRELMNKSEEVMNNSFTTDNDEALRRNDLKKVKMSEHEDFIIELLNNLIQAINVGEPETHLIQFILDEVLNPMASEDRSFKTKLAIIHTLSELSHKLTDSGTMSISTTSESIVTKIFHIWRLLSVTCTAKENIQTVLVAFCQLTYNIASEFIRYESVSGVDYDKTELITALKGIENENVNSVVTRTASKNIEKIRKI